VDHLHLFEILPAQFEADPPDDHERAVDERRIALNQRQQLADDEAHRDDAENAAGNHDPQLRRHRDRDEDRVNREDEIGELDTDDGPPERRESHPRPGRRRAAPRFRITAPEEVLIRQPHQIERTQQLHQRQLDHVRREEDRDPSKQERSDDPVAERLLLLMARKSEHQDREDHRVVGAQKPFEKNEEADRDEVGRRKPGPRHTEAAGRPAASGRAQPLLAVCPTGPLGNQPAGAKPHTS